MDHNDPRQTAVDVGAMIGQPQLAQDVLSGRLSATESAPLLAGMIETVVHAMFIPVVGATSHEQFNAVPPNVATVTLLDGSRLRITVEAL